MYGKKERKERERESKREREREKERESVCNKMSDIKKIIQYLKKDIIQL